MTDLRTFGINAMIADMEPLWHRVLNSNIEYASVQSASIWPVSLPPGELELTVLALVVDVCAAMEAGDTLTIETRNVHIDGLSASRFRGVAPGDYVTLAIGGSGRASLAALTQAMLSPAAQGGIGVKLMFDLAARSGGFVDVEEHGDTTQLRLHLPRAVSATLADKVGTSGLPTGTETVLVVEDLHSLMLATQRVLTRLGYSVLAAGSAEVAIKQARGLVGDIDLLLTDVSLPGMDGVALAHRLCQERPSLKVLFMSGFSEQALRLPEALPSGFALVEKPFTASTLAQAVRNALGTK